MKFCSYSTIFPIGCNGSVVLNKPSWKITVLSLVNEWCVIIFASPFYIAQLFVIFSALSILFSLSIFSKNDYLFIGYR